ncbi:trypsin-like peptidase domain-containing protein [Hydrogenibacillus sp. N12]|uniref:S1C family serine protease n=1 Tax=Hydrogenibacillus sp. N12 TaxID=2866627 RepID=UPI00207BDECF|nr:trypsin-like peptidase domain-containing protein [Hydrogenibacillus sp. N12]
MKRMSGKAVVLAFLAGVLFASGFWLGKVGSPLPSAGASPIDGKAAAAGTVEGKAALLPESTDKGHSLIAEMVKKAGPAVVRIETKIPARGGSTDEMLFFGPFPFSVPVPNQPSGSIGSGFFISEDGTILTNNHVIDKASEIKVYMSDRKTPLTAHVVGRDPELDLAVLKVDGKGPFPYLPLGDSDKMDVGDWVVAIGNPFGLDHTVTVGVLSAKGRPLTVEGKQFKNLLQTDASINPGNSGGPLLNLSGEVIGINTAVSAQGQGIGFAVPSNSVREVLNDLLTKGKVSRPWVGIGVQDFTPDIADYLGLPRSTKGALVSQVFDGSPAQKAGLRPGDVIVQFDGKDVADAQTLVDLIQQAKVGEVKKLLVNRGGELVPISVRIGEKTYQ